MVALQSMLSRLMLPSSLLWSLAMMMPHAPHLLTFDNILTIWFIQGFTILHGVKRSHALAQHRLKN
jgi:hypothetical protein